MTALGVSLLVVGAVVIMVEAHVPTLGVLGAPGVVLLAVGAVLAVSGVGGGVLLGVLIAVALATAGVGVVALSVRKGLTVRRRRIRAGPERLLGHVGVVRTWDGNAGCVACDGALWQARRSWTDQEFELNPGDEVVVERLDGLTLAVRPAEEWEVVT
jgi:membrane-bound serine protease (ClpP class)